MVACVFIPRFALRVAADDRFDGPAALAPLPGEPQKLGEVSDPAERHGVRPGMALAEALARSPSLRLIAPDAARAEEVWEELLGRLEGIGAAVESERAGEAFFSADGLRMIHGEVAGVLAATRAAMPMQAQIAAAPNRFASFLAAERGVRLPREVCGHRGEAIVPARALRAFLTPFPVKALMNRLDAGEAQTEVLIGALARLGLTTLGRLAALGDDQVADRFGRLGLRALRLARGEDAPLRPRVPPDDLAAAIELPEGMAGSQLEHALELLVDRLLASPARKQRTVVALRLSASLCGGGSWSKEQTLGRPSASARSIRTVLAPRLEALPGPAAELRLRATALGPPVADQCELPLAGRERRRRRLAAAVREVHAAAGPDALLRVIDADPRSGLPERRAFLAPLPEP